MGPTDSIKFNEDLPRYVSLEEATGREQTLLDQEMVVAKLNRTIVLNRLGSGQLRALARHSGGMTVTAEMHTPQESEAWFSIYSEFAITPETLPHYRLPIRGTSLGVLQ
jgi:hypothetical protein